MLSTFHVPVCASGPLVWMVYLSLPVPVNEGLTCAIEPSGAIHVIRRATIVPVTTAHACWPSVHVFCGVVQSLDANVSMLSEDALTKPPRVISEAERATATSITLRPMPAGSALNLDSFLEIVFAASRVVDDRIDLLILLTIWTRVPSPRYFIMVLLLNSLRPSSPNGS
jgi:hypothetical protein